MNDDDSYDSYGPTWTDLPYEAFERRCEDCGVLLDRHGAECGMETDDPRAEGYFPPAGWALPTDPGVLVVLPGAVVDVAGDDSVRED